MPPRTFTAKGDEKMIRTTLLLPEDLWRAAKTRAIDEGSLAKVIGRALEAYLAKPLQGKKGGK